MHLYTPLRPISPLAAPYTRSYPFPYEIVKADAPCAAHMWTPRSPPWLPGLLMAPPCHRAVPTAPHGAHCPRLVEGAAPVRSSAYLLSCIIGSQFHAYPGCLCCHEIRLGAMITLATTTGLLTRAQPNPAAPARLPWYPHLCGADDVQCWGLGAERAAAVQVTQRVVDMVRDRSGAPAWTDVVVTGPRDTATVDPAKVTLTADAPAPAVAAMQRRRRRSVLQSGGSGLNTALVSGMRLWPLSA